VRRHKSAKPWQIKSLSGSCEQIALMLAHKLLYILCFSMYYVPMDSLSHLRIPPSARLYAVTTILCSREGNFARMFPLLVARAVGAGVCTIMARRLIHINFSSR